MADLYTETFDAMTTGSAPSGWVESGVTGVWTVQTAPTGLSSKSVRSAQQTGSAFIKKSSAFTRQTSGTIWLNYRTIAGSNVGAGYSWGRFQIFDGTTFVTYVAIIDGLLKILKADGSAFDTVVGIAASTVYRVSVELDLSNKKVLQIVLNGTAYNNAGAGWATNASAGGADALRFDSFSTNAVGGEYVWFDDIVVFSSARTQVTAGTLYASGTHVSTVCGCDKYGQVTTVYDHPNGTDGVGSVKVERSSDNATWANISSESQLVRTSLGSNDWKAVDRRPQRGSQSVAYGATAYYRATALDVYGNTLAPTTSVVSLTADVDKAAVRAANYAVLSTGMAGTYVASSVAGHGAYAGEHLMSMALGYAETSTAQYLTDSTNQYEYIRDLLTNADDLILFPDFADFRPDFHARTALHAAFAARILRHAGQGTLADQIIAQCDIWAKALLDVPNSGTPYFTATIAGTSANTQPAWSAGAAITAGMIRRPTVTNDRSYRALNSGTTHASTQPTWPTTTGATVTDNGITWKETSAAAVLFWQTYTGTSPYASGSDFREINQQVEIGALFAMLCTDATSDFFTAGAYRTEALTVITGTVAFVTACQSNDGSAPLGSLDAHIATLYAGYTTETMAVIYQLLGSQHDAHQLWMSRTMDWLDGFATEPLTSIDTVGATTTPGMSELMYRSVAQHLLNRTLNVESIAYSAAFWDSATDNWGDPYAVNGGVTPYTPTVARWEAQAVYQAVLVPTPPAAYPNPSRRAIRGLVLR